MTLVDAGFDTLPHDLALELCKHGQHSGENAASGRGHVKGLGQGNEPDPQLGEFLQSDHEVGERASPSVESLDQDPVDFTTADGG